MVIPMTKKLEQMLETVRTTKETYLGYITSDDGKYLHLTQAAIIPDNLYSQTEIAFHYFCEKARRNTKPYDIPLTAIESRTADDQITMMFNSYEELSKVANRQTSGKIKISRLKKLLGSQVEKKVKEKKIISK